MAYGNRRPRFAAILPNTENQRQCLTFFAVTVHEVKRHKGPDFFSLLVNAGEDALDSALPLFP